MTGLVSYHNKVVVVTGAATGVGAALVRQLRGAGAAQIIALDIKPCGGSVDRTITVDLSDPKAIDDAVGQLPPTVDVLFNNAGVAATLPTDIVMSVNVLAPRKLINDIKERIPVGGAIANTASSAGGGYPARLNEIRELLAIEDWQRTLDWVAARPVLTNNPYGFSKECAQVLTLQSAHPLAQSGIRINSVCPGIIETPLLADFQASQGEAIIDWMVSQSGGRWAQPGEIASVLAFLGSDSATYITGTNVLVDNGFTAAILSNQVDYTSMPAVDALMNSAS